MYYFLLVFGGNRNSARQRFRNIASFTMYATVCDFYKFFSFDSTLHYFEIIGHL